MADSPEHADNDYRLADALVDSAGEMFDAMATFADHLGMSLYLPQVLGAVLGVAAARYENRVTREEFMNVWDVFERRRAEALARSAANG